MEYSPFTNLLGQLSQKSILIKHPNTVFLWILVLIALGLRLYRLDFQSLWVDEIASMNGADPDASWSTVVEYSISDQPPAFFLLLHGWFKVFPFNDISGRLFSVTLGIAGIFAMYLLGKEVKGGKTGLTAAAITSFSYIHILFSQDVRFYTLVFLSSALSYLFFIKAVKENRPMHFVLYSLCTTLLLYTHYFGLVVFASQGIIFCLLIIFYPFDRKFILSAIASGISIVLMIIPWIPIFFSDVQTNEFWIQAEPIYFLIKYFYVYFKDVLSCVIFASLLIFYFASLLNQFKTQHSIDRVDFILIASVSLSFLIPIIYSIVQTPLLHVRYTLIVLPPLIVMICLGFNLIKISFQRILLIATCCTAFLSLVFIEKYYTKIQKEDWRGMISRVNIKGSPTDSFVSQKAWYCNYYFKSLHSPYRAVLPEHFDLRDQKPHGIWWLDAFNVIPGSDKMEINFRENGYVLKGTDSLFRARATYYQIGEGRRSD